MFYLRLNKIRIFNNYRLLGSSDLQLMSFVTMGEADFRRWCGSPDPYQPELGQISKSL